MRPGPIFLAVVLLACAWQAQAQTDPAAARNQFQAELSEQCPDKQLQLLSARDLRDGLDDYKEGLPQEERDRLQQAENHQCSTENAGAECVNEADIATASELGLTTDLAASICTDFLRCRDQGACDYAR